MCMVNEGDRFKWRYVDQRLPTPDNRENKRRRGDHRGKTHLK